MCLLVEDKNNKRSILIFIYLGKNIFILVNAQRKPYQMAKLIIKSFNSTPRKWLSCSHFP